MNNTIGIQFSDDSDGFHVSRCESNAFIPNDNASDGYFAISIYIKTVKSGLNF